MSDAASRSKSVRLALGLAAALIVVGALSWWMRGARHETAGGAVETTARPIAAPAFELEAAAVESAGLPATPTRKAEDAALVVDPAAQDDMDWGRLLLIVRSSDPQVAVTKGTASLSPRTLRNRKQLEDLMLSPMTSSVRDATIDASGRVAFDKLVFGDWVLEVKADGFDRAQRSLTIENSAIMNLEVTVEPLAMTELAVVLRHPNGIPLFDALQGAEREIANALRPAFLAECPVIGVDLPESVHRLVQRSRFVREEHPDQWMHATFKKPVAGCACVLLGERVLDAVPFVAGQEVVVLRVNPEALRGMRASLLIRVREAGPETPIANATVKIKDAFGGERTLQTDALGTALAKDLLPIDAIVEVIDDRYMRGQCTVTLSPGAQAEAPPFLLARSTSIRGIVTWPAADKPVRAVMIMRMQPPWSQSGKVVPDASGTRGTFAFTALTTGEYLVGFPTGPPYATPERVRSGEARAWKIVDTSSGNVDDVVIDVPKDLLDLMYNRR